MASALLARTDWIHVVIILDLGHSVAPTIHLVRVGRHLHVPDVLHAGLPGDGRIAIFIREFSLPHAVFFGPRRLLLTLGLRGARLVGALEDSRLGDALWVAQVLTGDEERGGPLVVCQLIRGVILGAAVD